MRVRLRSLLLVGTALILATGAGTGGPPDRGPLEVSLEVVVNPVEGPPRTACRNSTKPGAGTWEGWVTFARVRPHPQEGWDATGSEVRCGSGPRETPGAGSEGPPQDPYLRTGASVSAGYLPSDLNSKLVTLLRISLHLERFSGYGEGGKPVYTQSDMKRDFNLLDRRDALIPLLVADQEQRETLGVREIFLSIGVGPARDTAAAAYGTLRVSSGMKGGDLLLDGGVAGKIAGDADIDLRNVLTGMHSVEARDSAGRKARKVVRVEADRTVLVELNPPGPEVKAAPYQLTPLGRNAEGFDEFRRGGDGAVVVRVPAGECLMGNKETERSPLEHRVYVSEFLMDKTPVTWGEYKRFAAETGMLLPPHDPYWGIHDDHPVSYVTWEEAKTYCEWAGGRLPTEAEREKAARGTDSRKYPWGNEEPDPQRGVYRHEWGWEATEAVGTHPKGVSPYGLLDMGGNVWEYCSDWFDDNYYQSSPSRDPKGPPSGNAHVARGGSWDSRPTVLSCSCRNWGYLGYREGDFGFRCAMNAPR